MNFFDEHYTYLYSEVDGTPVYAGCTRNLKQRMGRHQKTASWWTPDLQLTFTVHPFQEPALDAESVLINDLRPRGNRRIPPDPRIRLNRALDDLEMRLFPLEEAAALLEITPEELSTAVRDGHLCCIDIGDEVSGPMPRITGKSLVAYDVLLEAAS